MVRHEDDDLRIRPALFDRLLAGDDDEWDVARLEDAVLRDLDRLLNTRPSWPPVAPESESERKGSALVPSVLDYGLQDFSTTAKPGDDPHSAAIEQARKRIREAILLYERRLTGVDVQVAHAGPRSRGSPTSLVFRVTATLQAAPDAPQVECETIVHTADRAVEVRP